MLDGLMIGWAIRQSLDKSASASGASSTASAAKSEAEALRIELDRLSMVTEALWIMLKEQGGYTDEHLVAKIHEIDMRDGQLNGKTAKEAPKSCPRCNRTLAKRMSKCMYCGQEIEWSPFDR